MTPEQSITDTLKQMRHPVTNDHLAKVIVTALRFQGYKIMPRELTESMNKTLSLKGYRAMWDAAS